MKKLLSLLFCLAFLLSSTLAAEVPAPAAGPHLPSTEPSAPVTRGQFVEALWLLWGGVPYEDTRVFSDVSHDRSDTTAICWAYDLGLVKGTGGGSFAPDRPITREEAALLLRRAAEALGLPVHPSHLAECDDYSSASPWAGDAIYWAVEAGFLPRAEGGLLAPKCLLFWEEMEYSLHLLP